MLQKLGVDISRLNRPIRRALNTIDRVYARHGYEAVITSTYEGNHSPGSLHYSNDAVDTRRAPKGNQLIVRDLRSELGSDFDVVPERDHNHIEYDPKSP